MTMLSLMTMRMMIITMCIEDLGYLLNHQNHSENEYEDCCFSRSPVWSQTTTSGFHQQVFVMYHSTNTEDNVESILH